MAAITITVTKLADLRKGDVVISAAGVRRRKPITVERPLGPIAVGVPVEGVVFEKDDPSDIDMVFYPSQLDGKPIVIERRTAEQP